VKSGGSWLFVEPAVSRPLLGGVREPDKATIEEARLVVGQTVKREIVQALEG
jgi:hypothetical protein